MFVTVQGAGGTGKSTVIHVIVSTLERMFPQNKVTITCAPTGSASYNINGTTAHSQFGVNCTAPEKDVTQKKLDVMIGTMKYTIAIIMDERSMISASLLGACEKHARQGLHNGMDKKKPWGGAPIVIFFGDDYQCGSVNKYNKGRGATFIFDENLEMNDLRNPSMKSEAAINERNGFELFLKLSANVIEFKNMHRVNPGQQHLSQILDNMRYKGGITTQQAQMLVDRNIDFSGKIDAVHKEKLRETATWIFPTCRQVTEKNFQMMQKIVSMENPICNIFAKCLPTETNTINKFVKSHFLPETLKLASVHSSLCRGSRNALDRNLWAEKGLYNGAPIEILEPRFNKGENPNRGDEPVYILAYCPTYSGPAWQQTCPKIVPLPIVKTLCSRQCCQIRQAPIQLAYARTGLKFQGQQVGPAHTIKAIIADPGDIKHEARCPGYTYMICSRVSTLGNNPQESALFFTGINTTEERFTNLTNKRSGNNEKYLTVQRRDNWNRYIQQQIQQTNIHFSEDQMRQLEQWVNHTTFDTDNLSRIIRYHANNHNIDN